MTKQEYLNSLRIALGTKPQEEVDSALIYVQEYFDELMDDEKAIQQLGTPQEFAKNILGQDVFSTEEKNKSPRKNKLWLIILGILSAPISIPLLVAVILLLLSIFIIGLSLYLITLALGLGGFALIASSATILLNLPKHAVVMVFAGIALIGLSIVLFMLLLRLTSVVIEALSKKIHRRSQKGVTQ